MASRQDHVQDVPVGRNSPSSAVCYHHHHHLLGSDAAPPRLDTLRSSASPGPAGGSGDDSDSTPRSEVPSLSNESAAAWLPPSQVPPALTVETNYFSPTPVRYYPTLLRSTTPRSATASTEPPAVAAAAAATTSTTASPRLNASANSLREIAGSILGYDKPLSPYERRGSVQRDFSTASSTTTTVSSSLGNGGSGSGSLRAFVAAAAAASTSPNPSALSTSHPPPLSQLSSSASSQHPLYPPHHHHHHHSQSNQKNPCHRHQHHHHHSHPLYPQHLAHPHSAVAPAPHKKHSRELPQYPNQAYSALHTQYYPPPHVPPTLRTRSSHPSQFPPFSAIEPEYAHHDHFRHAFTEASSRTAGNSPASSPGLFSPSSGPRIRPSLDSLGEQGYSSPYLHYTHRQMPKETHKADVDVDPISGRKLINDYEVIDELGRGVHGKVKLGRNLHSGKYVAIKIVDRYQKRKRLGKNTSQEDKIRREIAILKKARHPNIVSLLEVIDDPTAKKVYIVLEHVEMGEVRWRAEGPKEIILIEYRRHQREMKGLTDKDAAVAAKAEDDMILQVAARRRERQGKQRVREMQRQRLKDSSASIAAGGHESWSFEHGGETDDDYDESASVSRTSTVSTAIKARNMGDLQPQQEQEHQPQPQTPTTPVNQRLSEGADSKRTAPSATTAASSGESGSPASPSSATPTGPEPHSPYASLEGTMYGAYEPEEPRGRTPSVASSSSASYLAELDDADEIPEHFHHVPLMTLTAAREALRDTVLGLEYLHYQGVIHRDIKPANLLQTKDHQIKISDFGVSYLGRQHHGDSSSSVAAGAGDQSESEMDVDEAVELAKTVGTPAFYAPELCQTDEDAEPLPVTAQIDVWALGVTLYCLIYGRVPFHSENAFALMRTIAEEEVLIPRWRLKAVDEHAGSRPNSHNRYFQTISSNKRSSHDLLYEEVNEDLRDLLKRLLIKDPRKRIQLKEVKRHPWLLEGIPNKIAWVEDTDPSRQTQGRKIEVSTKDVEDAVVPLTILDRMRSSFRKLGGALALGLGGGSRRRAKSSTVMNEHAVPSSTASTVSNASQEGRRPSLRLDESISVALRFSRESDHPLSRSVTASPDTKDSILSYLENLPRPQSPGTMAELDDTPGPLLANSSSSASFSSSSAAAAAAAPPPPPSAGSGSLTRPAAPERAYSSMSSAASIRTIRQSDVFPGSGGEAVSPLAPPGLPGTPTALESPSGAQLGGLFGGAPRRLIRSTLSHGLHNSGLHHGGGISILTKRPETHLGHSRSKSIDRLVEGTDDSHGGPSLAISNAVAIGHVDQPPLLKDQPTPGSSPQFHMHYNNPSDYVQPHLKEYGLGRSTSSASPHRHSGGSIRAIHNQSPLGRAASASAALAILTASPPLPIESSEERIRRAQEENLRRRKLEEQQQQEQAQNRHREHRQRPQSGLSQITNPPSPDDDSYFRGIRLDNYLNENQSELSSSVDVSPTGYPHPLPPPPHHHHHHHHHQNQNQRRHRHQDDNNSVSRVLTSSSSEDQFTSISQSTSNPSIPSIISASSSVAADDFPVTEPLKRITTRSSDDTLNLVTPKVLSGDEYDHVVESADDEDEESDNDFFEIPRRANKQRQNRTRSGSVSNAELSRHHRLRRDTGNSGRLSTRSGSNGTVKKAWGRNDQSHDEEPTEPKERPVSTIF